MIQESKKSDLRLFFIKLIGISISVIIIINITYNLLFAEKFEKINELLNVNNKESVEQIKDKIRIEIKKGLRKENILNQEDKVLLLDLYNKLKKEFKEVE
jgi:hypothetical protein